MPSALEAGRVVEAKAGASAAGAAAGECGRVGARSGATRQARMGPTALGARHVWALCSGARQHASRAARVGAARGWTECAATDGVVAQRDYAAALSTTASSSSTPRNSARRRSLAGRLEMRRRRRVASPPSAAKGFLRELQEIRSEADPDASSNGAAEDALAFTPPLSVVKYPDPRLRQPNRAITTFDDRLQKLAAAMFDVMYATDGIGLAAPQVGVNVRVMVYNEEGVRGKGEEIVLVNPKIVRKSKGQTLFEEGCLSFPGINGDVKRPKTVEISAFDVNGGPIKMELDGLQARIFQHEFDHLQGTLFHDRMAAPVLATVRDQLVAMEEVFAKEHPGVRYQAV